MVRFIYNILIYKNNAYAISINDSNFCGKRFMPFVANEPIILFLIRTASKGN